MPRIDRTEREARRTRGATAALLALAIVLVPCTEAPAAVVRMDVVEEREEGETFLFGSVEVAAAAGEVNTLQVTYTPAGGDGPDELLVTDATAPLTAGDRCRQVDASTVRCRDADVPEIVEAAVDLGDMDDRAATVTARLDVEIAGGAGNDDLSGTWVRLAGGPGDDRLTGGAGEEVLEGDAGADALDGAGESDYIDGGPGDDVLRGGDGNDSLYAGGSFGDPAPAGRDTLDGGPGSDVLSDEDELAPSREIGPDTLDGGTGVDSVHSYILRTSPVRVDLTTTTGQGQQGENDTLTGFENVMGGARADVLIGNGAPNHIDGGRGRDEIRGGAGHDRLLSLVSPGENRPNRVAKRYGPDAVFGDAGNDLIETLPSMESEIACGDGEDRVELASFASDKAPSSQGPLITRSCERLAMAGTRGRRSVIVDPWPVRVTRDSLVFAVPRARTEHALQIRRAARPQEQPATAPLRRGRVSVRVGASVIRASRRRAVRMRGKITEVGVNRFVWRFDLGGG